MRALLVLVLLASCGTATPELRFPAEVGGGWRLAGSPIESSELALADTRSHGLKRLMAADYQGEGNPKVLAHEMSSSASAFEALQRFRPESSVVAFQYGIFLVVVQSSSAGPADLNRFAGEFKQAINQ